MNQQKCPLCNNEIIINSFNEFVCSNLNKYKYSEFISHDFYEIIQSDYIVIDYHIDKKCSYFSYYRENISFKLNLKFKIINCSVEETFEHYNKMRMFI